MSSNVKKPPQGMTEGRNPLPNSSWYLRHQRILAAIAVVSVLFLGVYFRIYNLTGPNFIQKRQIHKMAGMMARNGVAQQITAGLPPQMQQLQEKKRDDIVNKMTDSAIKEQPSQFNYSTWVLEQQLIKSYLNNFSPDYYPDPDSYYYLQLTKNIVNTGKLGPASKEGKFYNPLRRAPHGNWDRITWHPYAGYFVYKFLSRFDPDIKLMHAAGITPVILVFLAGLAWFAYARAVRADLFSSWLGGLIFILAPLGLQRSIYGWYDTDPYTLLFCVLIAACYLSIYRDGRKWWLYAIAGGVLAGVYSLYWHGWNFILALIGTSSVALTAFMVWGNRSLKNNPPLLFLPLFGIVSVGVSLLLLGPEALLWALRGGVSFVAQTQARTLGAWPNLMVLIGETNTVSALRWIYLTGGFTAAFLVFMGTIPAGISLWRKKDKEAFHQWLALFIMFLSIFFISFDTERFTFLMLIPYSLISVFGIRLTRDLLSKVFVKLSFRLPRVVRPGTAAVFAGAVLVLALMPLQLWAAHLSATKTPRIMNEIWEKALVTIKEKTPEDAIVFSWWSPGYLVASISERRVMFDGGTQHTHEHLWMAKVFMTDDEKLAVGILRMLSISGNDVIVLLADKGWQLDEAVETVESIVVLNRGDAALALAAKLDPASVEKVLDLTHGKEKPVPSVMLIYNSLMEKNIMLQVIGKWNFKRAEKILSERKTSRALFNKSNVRDYTRRMFQIAESFMRYESNIPAVKRNGPALVFENGLVVDLEKKRAFAPSMDKGAMDLQPVPLYYKEGNKWVLHDEPGSPRNFVVFLNRKAGIFTANLFQKEMLQSLLFRLYYFQGEGLKYHKSVVVSGSEDQDTYALAYEIDWDSFLKDLEAAPAAGPGQTAV